MRSEALPPYAYDLLSRSLWPRAATQNSNRFLGAAYFCTARGSARFMITPLEISRERLEPASLRKYHPSSARWIMIQRFLDVKGPEYERVLMVDVGQIFFQANPFDIIGNPGENVPRGLGALPRRSPTLHTEKPKLCLCHAILFPLIEQLMS